MTNKLTLCLLIAFAAFSTASFAQSLDPLRIMTYNVRNAKGMDKNTDYERVAMVVRNEHPDIVAMQELDSGTSRSGNRYVLKEIAQQAGYHYRYSRAISFDGGAYGIGVLSKENPLAVTSVSLPGTEEQRTLAMVEFKKFVLFAVHLSLTEKDREASVQIINEQLKNFHKPVFLAGDFNAEPPCTAVALLKKAGWQLLSGEASTFPSDTPRVCIDYIFAAAENPYRVRAARVVNEPVASDHRPVVVDLIGRSAAKKSNT